MICTSVVPCLSSGLAKNNKIMLMFVIFPGVFLPFWKTVFFFENVGTNLTPKQSNRMFLSCLSKVQQLSNNFFKKARLF